MKLDRTRDQWENCDPEAMSKMSQAAIYFALKDAKHDILALHAELARAASPQLAQTKRALTTESIEATSALIANSLLGAAPEEDVREVEWLINEMLGRT